MDGISFSLKIEVNPSRAFKSSDRASLQSFFAFSAIDKSAVFSTIFFVRAGFARKSRSETFLSSFSGLLGSNRYSSVIQERNRWGYSPHGNKVSQRPNRSALTRRIRPFSISMSTGQTYAILPSSSQENGVIALAVLM